MSSRTIQTVFACGLILLACSFSVHAQSLPLSNSGLNLTTSSDNPQPGQSVTITAKSFSIDINSATVSWIVNGKVAQKDTGLTAYTLQAPAVGKTTTVKVTAVTSKGITLSNSLVLTSNSVDLIVEPDGYVPPFFKGKNPTVYQNKISIIAFPHIMNGKTEYDPKTLIYTWKRNGIVLDTQSGYGKQKLTLVGDAIPRPFSISVDVGSKDGSAGSEGTVNIDYVSPAVGFYVNDPLYGPFFNTQVIDTVRIGGEKETGIVAVPFGFNSVNPQSSDLSLKWLITGQEHPELDSNRTVILRAPDDSAGTSNVELDLQNTSDILQKASMAFSAQFSAGGSSSTTDSSVNF